jgi:hypothetical protein
MTTITKHRWIATQEDVSGAFKTSDGESFPRNWLDLATADDLQRVGIEAYEYTPPPKPGPSTDPADYTLTARQLRLGLLSLEVTSSDVLGAINLIDGAVEREAALIEWEYAGEYEFDHPLVSRIMTSLEINDEAAASAWIAAAGL